MSGTASPGGLDGLRRRFPRTVAILATLLALFLVADAILAVRYIRYRSETARLRDDMSDAERQRADLVEATEQDRLSVALELLRRQAAGDRQLHLAVAVDSGMMLLERDGARLREMPVTIPPERVVGVAPDTLRIAAPRGARSIERTLGLRDVWEVPAWVFADRGLPVPTNRAVAGALGRDALVLSGGVVIYALPDSGILADSSYVLPGAVRVARADLRAIAPNIAPGVTVYFYE